MTLSDIFSEENSLYTVQNNFLCLRWLCHNETKSSELQPTNHEGLHLTSGPLLVMVAFLSSVQLYITL